MTVKELQAKAKKLSIDYKGMRKTDLEEAIKAKEGVSTQEAKPGDEKNEIPADMDTAVVYNGKQKVRIFNKSQHGEKFIDLAEEFISKPGRSGYKIAFEKAATFHVCPNCHFKF